MPPQDVNNMEVRLVRDAANGDRDAMHALFERYRHLAYRVALRVTGNEQDALDVVQDGFIKAFGGLPTLQKGARFKSWLLRIVHNQALDALRVRQVRKAASLDEDKEGIAGEVPHHRDEGPQRMLEHREGLDRIQQAIETLPMEQRSVFSLYAQGELTYGEIAEIAGIPIGTVMSRLYHARRRLRDLLDDLQAGLR